MNHVWWSMIGCAPRLNSAAEFAFCTGCRGSVRTVLIESRSSSEAGISGGVSGTVRRERYTGFEPGTEVRGYPSTMYLDWHTGPSNSGRPVDETRVVPVAVAA